MRMSENYRNNNNNNFDNPLTSRHTNVSKNSWNKQAMLFKLEINH